MRAPRAELARFFERSTGSTASSVSAEWPPSTPRPIATRSSFAIKLLHPDHLARLEYPRALPPRRICRELGGSPGSRCGPRRRHGGRRLCVPRDGAARRSTRSISRSGKNADFACQMTDVLAIDGATPRCSRRSASRRKSSIATSSRRTLFLTKEGKPQGPRFWNRARA